MTTARPTTPVDAADLTARLIQCPSVTPLEGGALILLQDMLGAAGFDCTRVDRNGVPNLFARWGARGAARSFGFNGHTDVVPVGDEASWTYPPFSARLVKGQIWGRGATDMKSGVAAFVAAAIDFVTATPPDGAVVLAITGDEEGPGWDGTRALLDWMNEQGEKMSVCIVGESSNPDQMGEMIKIGRRGSITFRVTARGVQGHVAYPRLARNPVHALISFLGALTSAPLDQGTPHFQPSGLQVTTIDVGNPASNVVPQVVTAVFNIRFNDLHRGDTLDNMVRARAAAVSTETGVVFDIDTDLSGDAFVTEPGEFVGMVRDVVEEVTGRRPELSTSGGTSDARFVKDPCAVVECGLVGRFMHQVDERVPVAEIEMLKYIYMLMLARYFDV